MQMKKIVNYRPLFYCFLALFGAIVFAKYIFLSDYIAISLFSLFIIFITALGILYKKYLRTIIVLVFIIIGILGYAVEMNYFPEKYYPENSVVSGRVCGKSSLYGTKQYIILEENSINNEKISENIYLVLYGAPYLTSGDKIIFVANLSPISPFDVNGKVQSSFYKNNCYYYATKASNTEISIVNNDQKLNETIQDSVKEKLIQNMTEENANIAYAMLFGDKSEIEYDTKYNYQISGICHILAVSGLHVGIIVTVIYWMLKKLKAKNYVILLVIVPILFFYGYLCGFSPSILRASIMSTCLLFANCFGKRYDSLSAIGFAGIFLLLIKPLYAFDVGFQLSFGCVIGIAIFYKSVYQLLRKKIKKFIIPNFIAKPLATTISTQILILPVLISTFNGASFLSIFINVIVVPIFYIAFIITFLSTPLVFISNCFGGLLWFSSLIMEFIGVLANFVSLQTWSVIPNFKFIFSAFVCFFTLLFFSSRLILLKRKSKLFVLMFLFGCSGLILGLSQIS